MSISIGSAAGPSAWRKAVVGAVAVLAVAMGAAAGSFLVAGRAAGVGGAASYVPSSAPFYAELRLDASPDQDAALRQVLGRFPPIEGLDLDADLYGQLGKHIDRLLADHGTDVSWANDVEPWFDGRIGLAVLDIPPEAMSGGPAPDGEAVPPMVALLGVTDPAAAEAGIQRLLTVADAPVDFTEQDHAGVTIHVGGDQGAWAVTGDQLLIAPRAEDIVTALDAHADPSATVAELDEIATLTDALPDDWLAFVLYDLRDVMAAAIDVAGVEAPEMADTLRSLVESQPLRGVLAFGATGDRLAIDVATDPPRGDLAVQNADRGLADEVPGDAIYYSEAGNLGQSLVAAIGLMKDALGASPDGPDQIATMEAALGADLAELVSWIDDGAVAIGVHDGVPYGGMVLVPNDVAVAQRRLSQLSSFARLAGIDPESGVTVEESEHGSQTITTIRWHDPSASADPMMPVPNGVTVEYTVTDDRALIGFGEGFVVRALELDPADSLANEGRFRDAVDELGGSTAVSLVWLDIAGARDAIEDAIGPGIGGFGADAAYDAEVRPWLLPLDRLVSVSRLEGEVLVQRSALLVE